MRALAQLIVNVGVADDRSRDKLRKERNVCAECGDVLLNARVAAVYVDDVGERLERVERYSDRQRQPERGENSPAEQRIERPGKEIVILEYAEERKIYHDRDDKRDLRPLRL